MRTKFEQVPQAAGRVCRVGKGVLELQEAAGYWRQCRGEDGQRFR